jgi:PAS domain S-box-containing protein
MVVMDGAVEELQLSRGGLPEGAGSPDLPLVLVAEDNAEMRRFIAEILSGEYRVEMVADGAEALTRAIAKQPDLIVTDLMMPELGGDRVVAEMRLHPTLTKVPVLVLLDKTDDGPRIKLPAESEQDYVVKPFSPRELRTRVQNLVTMKRTRDALQSELATQTADLSELTRQLVASRKTLKASLEKLQESEQRWRAIFENSAVSICLIGDSGCCLTANPVLQRILGYTEEELQSMPLMNLAIEEDRKSIQSGITHLLTGSKREYRFEIRYQRKDGGILWANTNLSIVPGTETMPRMLVGILLDTTERKRSNQALEEAKAELDHMSRVTTVGELTASIAHEINQPLTAIVTNANACRRILAEPSPDLQEVTEAVVDIAESGTRAAEIMSRVRALFKKTAPEKVPVNVNQIIQEVLDLTRGELEKHHVPVEAELQSTLPAILGDRVGLQQVVLNLIMNSIESMACIAPPARSLLIRSQDHESDGLLVTVRDSGPGLDPATIPFIFDAFFTTKPGGMGIGLSISRSIIEAHGGQLWATPNGSQGAILQFSLPPGV